MEPKGFEGTLFLVPRRLGSLFFRAVIRRPGAFTSTNSSIPKATTSQLGWAGPEPESRVCASFSESEDSPQLPHSVALHSYRMVQKMLRLLW